MSIIRNELVCVEYRNSSGDAAYKITRSAAGDVFYLYKAEGGDMVKKGRDKSPGALVERFCVEREIGVR